MLDEILRWLERSGSFWSYPALGLATFLEAVIPIAPGDVMTLFGVFLAVSRGLSAPVVYVAVTIGSICGGLCMYGLGRWLADKPAHRYPPFLRGPRVQRNIALVTERFAKHGATYLAINRFLPAIRGLVFITAGLSRVPLWRVALYGGVSAAIWNGALFAGGWGLGRNWERLRNMLASYTIVSTTIGASVVVLLLARWLWLRRKR